MRQPKVPEKQSSLLFYTIFQCSKVSASSVASKHSAQSILHLQVLWNVQHLTLDPQRFELKHWWCNNAQQAGRPSAPRGQYWSWTCWSTGEPSTTWMVTHRWVLTTGVVCDTNLDICYFSESISWYYFVKYLNTFYSDHFYIYLTNAARMYILYGTHSYWTSRYLYVPGQGSGKTSGPATTPHWVRLLHLTEGRKRYKCKFKSCCVN